MLTLNTPSPQSEVKPNSLCQSILWSIYNPHTKKVFSQSPGGLALYIIFVIIFYAFLLAYFALLMYLMIHYRLSKYTDKPFLTGINSFLRNTPGLHVHPFVNGGKLNLTDNNLLTEMEEDLKKYLKNSNTPTTAPSLVGGCANFIKYDSKPSATTPAAGGGATVINNKFCLYFGVNRLLEWTPPEDSELELSCEVNEKDVKLEYFPGNKIFEKNKFPYKFSDKNSWQRPIVAVLLSELKKDAKITVKCEFVGIKRYLFDAYVQPTQAIVTLLT